MKQLIARIFLRAFSGMIDDQRQADGVWTDIERLLDRILPRQDLSGEALEDLDAAIGLMLRLERAPRHLLEQHPKYVQSADGRIVRGGDEGWDTVTIDHAEVLQRGVLRRGSGGALEAAARKGSADDGQWVSLNADRLLRHVETRRKQCLRRIDPPSGREDDEIERLNIAIFFSRHARRTSDVRLLNAALKMNDWVNVKHLCKYDPKVGARHLLSLAEQEMACRELLDS